MRQYRTLLLGIEPIQQIHRLGLGIVVTRHLFAQQGQQKRLQVKVRGATSRTSSAPTPSGASACASLSSAMVFSRYATTSSRLTSWRFTSCLIGKPESLLAKPRILSTSWKSSSASLGEIFFSCGATDCAAWAASPGVCAQANDAITQQTTRDQTSCFGYNRCDSFMSSLCPLTSPPNRRRVLPESLRASGAGRLPAGHRFLHPFH